MGRKLVTCHNGCRRGLLPSTSRWHVFFVPGETCPVCHGEGELWACTQCGALLEERRDGSFACPGCQS